MRKYNCNVILCGPAIGKTYLSEHDDRFIDIDGLRSKYKYDLLNSTYEEFESDKYKEKEIINNDSIDYAINLLNKALKEGKIALISYHKEILAYILKNNIDYCLVYADKSLRMEYEHRMKERGNPDNFVYEMTNKDSWNKFYEDDENDKRPKYKIKLTKGQYLSNIKDYFVD